MNFDALIVGSGASAVNAAFPLVEAGLSVGMLDFGNQDRVYGSLVPKDPFLNIRKTDSDQHRYFLGNQFEGVPLNPLRVGAQLTPPRQYIAQDAEVQVPIDSATFSPMTSLALGGMASAWGAGSFPYNDEDLKGFPISHKDLIFHYRRVVDRIGVSGEEDDLSPFIGDLQGMFPPLEMDQIAVSILEKYYRRREKLKQAGFHMGKTRLAALSRKHRGRGPDQYLDMSFWGDSDRSVWRPLYSIQELQSHKNFIYLRPILIQSFKEDQNGTVQVTGIHMENHEVQHHRAKKLVLGAGILGTTRIVLRSLKQYGVKLPFVCNPYTYYPLLNLNMFGRRPTERTHSLAPLTVLFKPPRGDSPLIYGRVHSYRSLLNFKIIKEIPLPFREGMRVMKNLLPNLAILALDHEDHPTPDKYCFLKPGTSGHPDRMEIVYSLPRKDRDKQLQQEKKILGYFRKLGCIGLKRVWPGYGASLHYGGTLPMTHEEKDLTTTPLGRLRGTKAVYIVDSSVFPYLPSKGMTFTMMANADRIAEHIKREF